MALCGYQEPKTIRSKIFPTFRPTLPSMVGKVVAVTGCTTGTGFICAKVCAELGAQVIMLNRPSERADKALQDLKQEVQGANVTLVPCDLMSFASVKQAAEQLRTELTSLDVLCNNAGIMATKDEATADGFDTQMQTNFLSHFLLTAEVWSLLEKAGELRGEARVVNHSSIARKDPKKRLEERYLQRNGGNLGGNSSSVGGPRWARYQQTKLANLVFTYALHDRLAPKSSKVKALCAHPGFSSTNLQVTTVKEGGMGGCMMKMLTGSLGQSAEDGTIPLLTCCCIESVSSGDFYGPKGMSGPVLLLPRQDEEELTDETTRTLLWDASTSATGASFPI